LGKLKGFWAMQSSRNEDKELQQHNSNNAVNSNNNSSFNGKQSLRIPKTLAQNIIFNSLSKFLYHFVNFQLSFEISREVLLSFCHKYELDHNRTHLLLSELESIQKKTRFSITEREIKEMSMLKKIYREEKYGRDVHLILALTIKYINSDYTLKNILLISK
jgi:hypothetical protein